MESLFVTVWVQGLYVKLCHYAMPGVVCKAVDVSLPPGVGAGFFRFQCVGAESIRTIFS